MITKTKGVCLVRVRDTPVVLSHNERTRDEHGNVCVQHGLTSQVKASCRNETPQTTFFILVMYLE
jgi:hypothetical protein